MMIMIMKMITKMIMVQPVHEDHGEVLPVLNASQVEGGDPLTILHFIIFHFVKSLKNFLAIGGCPHITSAAGGGEGVSQILRQRKILSNEFMSAKDVCKRHKLSQLRHNICFLSKTINKPSKFHINMYFFLEWIVRGGLAKR